MRKPPRVRSLPKSSIRFHCCVPTVCLCRKPVRRAAYPFEISRVAYRRFSSDPYRVTLIWEDTNYNLARYLPRTHCTSFEYSEPIVPGQPLTCRFALPTVNHVFYPAIAWRRRFSRHWSRYMIGIHKPVCRTSSTPSQRITRRRLREPGVGQVRPASLSLPRRCAVADQRRRCRGWLGKR